MTTINHVDRRGGTWTFKLDVNPVQERIFRNLLGTLHNLGGREALTVSYYENERANREFSDAVETLVLAALRELTPKRKSERETPAEPEGEEGETYYWERF